MTRFSPRPLWPLAASKEAFKSKQHSDKLLQTEVSSNLTRPVCIVCRRPKWCFSWLTEWRHTATVQYLMANGGGGWRRADGWKSFEQICLRNFSAFFARSAWCLLEHVRRIRGKRTHSSSCWSHTASLRQILILS